MCLSEEDGQIDSGEGGVRDIRTMTHSVNLDRCSSIAVDLYEGKRLIEYLRYYHL